MTFSPAKANIYTHGCKTMPCTLDPSTYTYCEEDGYDHALWDVDWSREPPQYNSRYT